jgi:hypothetical protein
VVVGVTVKGLGKLLWGAAAIWLGTVAGARAQDSIIDQFKDFVFSGCIASREMGMPIDGYAQRLGLQRPNANLAAAFLRGRAGSAYIKTTPRTVLIIAETADTCTVSTRVARDLPGLVQSVEIGLALLPSGFTLVKEGKQPLLGGGRAAIREYSGLIGRLPFGILLSTTATGSPQATVTIFRKSR